MGIFQKTIDSRRLACALLLAGLMLPSCLSVRERSDEYYKFTNWGEYEKTDAVEDTDVRVRRCIIERVYERSMGESLYACELLLREDTGRMIGCWVGGIRGRDVSGGTKFDLYIKKTADHQDKIIYANFQGGRLYQYSQEFARIQAGKLAFVTTNPLADPQQLTANQVKEGDTEAMVLKLLGPPQIIMTAQEVQDAGVRKGVALGIPGDVSWTYADKDGNASLRVIFKDGKVVQSELLLDDLCNPNRPPILEKSSPDRGIGKTQQK